MNVLGSVFLGDAARQRVLSSPTSPPSSPKSLKGQSAPVPIDPQLSLELRLRWLEVLLLGTKHDAEDSKGKGQATAKLEHETLVRRAEDIQSKLDHIVDTNDGLRKFIDRYDQHAQILTPSFALSGLPDPPQYASMTSEELDVFLEDMEPEIRSADRDLREIEILEKRGVLGAGKLPECETLLPRLQELQKAHEEDLKLASQLEARVATVLERYATRIDALSELFVEWNDTLTVAESKITRLERERTQKVRLGFES